MEIIITIIVLLDAYYHKFLSRSYIVHICIQKRKHWVGLQRGRHFVRRQEQKLTKRLNDKIGILSAFFQLFIA